MALEELKKDIQFSVELRGKQFDFLSTWGLFSPRAVDNGTYLMLKQGKTHTVARAVKE